MHVVQVVDAAAPTPAAAGCRSAPCLPLCHTCDVPLPSPPPPPCSWAVHRAVHRDVHPGSLHPGAGPCCARLGRQEPACFGMAAVAFQSSRACHAWYTHLALTSCPAYPPTPAWGCSSSRLCAFEWRCTGQPRCDSSASAQSRPASLQPPGTPRPAAQALVPRSPPLPSSPRRHCRRAARAAVGWAWAAAPPRRWSPCRWCPPASGSRSGAAAGGARCRALGWTSSRGTRCARHAALRWAYRAALYC